MKCLCLRPDGSSPQGLTDAWGYESETPVEGNHHLYWTQSDERSHAVKIMQAEADGSSPRVLYTASHAYQIEMQQWHGGVYFRVWLPPVQDGSDPTAYNSTKSALYRVNPAHPSGVERLCALPDNTRLLLFDGDYAYCLAEEKKTGLTDTFRAESLQEIREVLYRYRLPIANL